MCYKSCFVFVAALIPICFIFDLNLPVSLNLFLKVLLVFLGVLHLLFLETALLTFMQTPTNKGRNFKQG